MNATFLNNFQPGSAISAAGSSASSSSSRRAKTRNYRVVSHTSQVDETLFGAPNHVEQRNQMLKDKMDQGISIEELARERSAKRKNSNRGKNDKETVQVITKDLIRNLMYDTSCLSSLTNL